MTDGQDFQKKFGNILNERDIITDYDTIAPHLVDWVGNVNGSSALMLTPRNSEQVSKILGLCNEDIRLPLSQIKEDTKQAVKKCLQELQLL